MTLKQIAKEIGRREKTVKSWARKAGYTHSEIFSKSFEEEPDFNEEQVAKILKEGVGSKIGKIVAEVIFT